MDIGRTNQSFESRNAAQRNDKVCPCNTRTSPKMTKLFTCYKTSRSNGRLLIKTGAQISLFSKCTSHTQLQESEFILQGVSGKAYFVYGTQTADAIFSSNLKLKAKFQVCELHSHSGTRYLTTIDLKHFKTARTCSKNKVTS